MKEPCVSRLAAVSRLDISAEALPRMAGELSDIIESMEILTDLQPGFPAAERCPGVPLRRDEVEKPEGPARDFSVPGGGFYE